MNLQMKHEAAVLWGMTSLLDVIKTQQEWVECFTMTLDSIEIIQAAGCCWLSMASSSVLRQMTALRVSWR